jgi:hypothetical protein
MQVRYAQIFLSNPKRTPRPANTEWVRRFQPKILAVVNPTLPILIL